MNVNSNELLIGANIIIPKINTGAITNSYGFFSITLPEGNYKVQISSVGFRSQIIDIELIKNINKNIYLDENIENLSEVILTKDVEEIDIKNPIMSLNILSNQTLKQTPVLFGESDVLKTIQLLPGVSSAGEGSGGFNVRGGAADQNLILFDEAIIYSSSHLFGLFSIFNSDAIKEVKLFKGGIPSSYGGRLSSVLDVYQKDGNSKEHKLSGGIGVISSRLLGEGPIKKNKGSYLIASRGSYAHLFLKFTDIENVAYFYDINTKSNYKIDKNNTLYFSGYFGRDKFKLSDTFSNTYGNSTLNLRWNHIINEKTFSNTSLIFSDYYYGLTLNFVGFDWNSGIQNFNFKYDFKHYLADGFKLQYGLNSIYYKFNPGDIKPSTSTSGINSFKLTDKYAFENAVYIDAEHKITDKLKQLSFTHGKFVINLKSTEASQFGNEQAEFLISTYLGAEPRPIQKVASGGELSRISLAIRVCSIADTNVPSMIFDEVDVGIGGGVAEIVGRLLKSLGESDDRQIFVITHLPQVAAQSSIHFKVSKNQVNNQTISHIEQLNEQTRIDEIARMLGGIEITATTMEHAKELLR